MNNFTISGTTLFLVLLSLALLLVFIIFILRKILFSGIKNTQTKSANQLMRYRTKHPEKDIHQYSGIFFKLGLLIATTIVVFAFSWTNFDPNEQSTTAMDYSEDLFIEQIPQKTYQKPKTKIRVPKEIIEIPEEDLIEEEPELEGLDVFEESEVYAEPEIFEKKVTEAPKLPLPEKNKDPKELFYVVEENPRFPGCEESIMTTKEKEACSKKELLKYIYSKLKYPAIARENGVEGMVVVQFVVQKDGSISEVKIMRDIGAGCGQAAALVVQSMNDMVEKWRPGKQRGRAVDVLFTLPVKFKLEG